MKINIEVKSIKICAMRDDDDEKFKLVLIYAPDGILVLALLDKQDYYIGIPIDTIWGYMQK